MSSSDRIETGFFPEALEEAVADIAECFFDIRSRLYFRGENGAGKSMLVAGFPHECFIAFGIPAAQLIVHMGDMQRKIMLRSEPGEEGEERHAVGSARNGDNDL